MNRWAFYSGVFFSALVIAFKLLLLVQGFYFTTWGFRYGNLLGVALYTLWIPITLALINHFHYRGGIPGREALKAGLGLVSVSIILISMYHYWEVQSEMFKSQALAYYNSSEYYRLLVQQQAQNPLRYKTTDIPRIISEQKNGLSPFRAMTGRMIPFLLYGGVLSLLSSLGLKFFKNNLRF